VFSRRHGRWLARHAGRKSRIERSQALRRLEARLVLGYLAPEQIFPSHIRGDENVSVDISKGHPAMDYAEHQRTYAGFLRFTKIAIVFLVLLLLGMKFFLV
jgi:hypothetical protein